MALPQTVPTSLANDHDSVLRRLRRTYNHKYFNNPVQWIYDYLAVELWSKQIEIVNSVFFNNKTTVRSCHSAGKTFIAACIVLAFLFLRAPCKIITSAPTYYQVVDLLWSEIRHLYKTRLQEKMGFPFEILTTKLTIRDDWFAKGISPKDSINFQGYHQKWVLVVLDESPGVRADIIEGAETLEASGDVHVLHIGNPLASRGHFYQTFRDPEFVKIHIPADSTPNFTGEKIPPHVAQQLTSVKWVEGRKKKWGETHALYIAKVKADFPDLSETQLTSLAVCERAQNLWPNMELGPEGEDVVGVDVAWYGDDLSVVTRRSGMKIAEIVTYAKMDPIELAGVVANMHNRKPFKVANVDVIGIGAGTLAQLQHLNIPAVGVNAAKKALNRREYFNRRTELWFAGRDWLLDGGAIPPNEDLLMELTAPEYRYKGDGRYFMEPKDAMKKKLGHSTDYADSYNLSVTRELTAESQMESTSMSADQFLANMGLSSGGNSSGSARITRTPSLRTPRSGVSSEDIIRGVVGGS